MKSVIPEGPLLARFQNVSTTDGLTSDTLALTAVMARSADSAWADAAGAPAIQSSATGITAMQRWAQARPGRSIRGVIALRSTISASSAGNPERCL